MEKDGKEDDETPFFVWNCKMPFGEKVPLSLYQSFFVLDADKFGYDQVGKLEQTEEAVVLTCAKDGCDTITTIVGVDSDSLSVFYNTFSAYLSANRKTPRRFHSLLSAVRWPSENQYFNSHCEFEFLENHYAIASLPSVGRLYVSRHTVLISLVLWSETVTTFKLAEVKEVTKSGRTLTIDGFSVTVVLIDEAYDLIVEMQKRIRTTKIQGLSLAMLQSRQNCVIPHAISQCVSYIKQNLGEEGLFRVSGSTREVAGVMVMLDEGESVEYGRIHDCCSVLKKMLGEMQPKLIEFFDDIKDSISEPNLHDLIESKTTPEKRKFLFFFFDFLAQIAKKSEENKMTSANLAMVFCPVLIDMPDLMNFDAGLNLIKRCIAEPQELF